MLFGTNAIDKSLDMVYTYRYNEKWAFAFDRFVYNLVQIITKVYQN